MSLIGLKCNEISLSLGYQLCGIFTPTLYAMCHTRPADVYEVSKHLTFTGQC